MPTAQRRPSWHHATESRHARGYGAAWDKLRLLILKRDLYLCQCDECKRTDRITPANQVDHIVPKAQGGTDAWSNLRSVNKQCHDRITNEQLGRKEKPQIGLDGYPIGSDVSQQPGTSHNATADRPCALLTRGNVAGGRVESDSDLLQDRPRTHFFTPPGSAFGKSR